MSLVLQRGPVSKSYSSFLAMRLTMVSCPRPLYLHGMKPTTTAVSDRRNGTSTSSTVLDSGSSANYSNYTSHSTATTNDQYTGVSQLARRIVTFIARQPQSEEGVHVGKIAQEVKADAGAIRYRPLFGF